jgi:hypothetical protein
MTDRQKADHAYYEAHKEKISERNRENRKHRREVWESWYSEHKAECISKARENIKRKPNSYPCWIRIRCRCNNPRNQDYRYYGGRGIKVCEDWDSFAAFYADMGDRPDGHDIHRKNSSLGYCKSNCIWKLSKEHRIEHLRALNADAGKATAKVSV